MGNDVAHIVMSHRNISSAALVELSDVIAELNEMQLFVQLGKAMPGNPVLS